MYVIYNATKKHNYKYVYGRGDERCGRIVCILLRGDRFLFFFIFRVLRPEKRCVYVQFASFSADKSVFVCSILLFLYMVVDMLILLLLLFSSYLLVHFACSDLRRLQIRCDAADVRLRMRLFTFICIFILCFLIILCEFHLDLGFR